MWDTQTWYLSSFPELSKPFPDDIHPRNTAFHFPTCGFPSPADPSLQDDRCQCVLPTSLPPVSLPVPAEFKSSFLRDHLPSHTRGDVPECTCLRRASPTCSVSICQQHLAAAVTECNGIAFLPRRHGCGQLAMSYTHSPGVSTDMPFVAHSFL